MKYSAMKYGCVLLLFSLPAWAEDKRLTEAKRLEAKAEKLLDAGKRAEAFDTLAKAAQLRDQVRADSSPNKKKKKTQKKQPPKSPSERLDQALRKGDIDGARTAWKAVQKERIARENRLARLEKQLEMLELQLAELRKLIER